MSYLEKNYTLAALLPPPPMRRGASKCLDGEAEPYAQQYEDAMLKSIEEHEVVARLGHKEADKEALEQEGSIRHRKHVPTPLTYYGESSRRSSQKFSSPARRVTSPMANRGSERRQIATTSPPAQHRPSTTAETRRDCSTTVAAVASSTVKLEKLPNGEANVDRKKPVVAWAPPSNVQCGRASQSLDGHLHKNGALRKEDDDKPLHSLVGNLVGKVKGGLGSLGRALLGSK